MLKIPPDYLPLSIQIALFVALWLVLKVLWFDPTLRIIQARRARSEGALEEARAIQAEADRLRAEHAAALDTARNEAQREMQEIVRDAEAEQKRLIAAAREDAQRTLTEVRTRMAEEVAAARQALRSSAGEIAQMVAHKILGRSA
jgi:F-type H+-transporting ATPase subunit b